MVGRWLVAKELALSSVAVMERGREDKLATRWLPRIGNMGYWPWWLPFSFPHRRPLCSHHRCSSSHSGLRGIHSIHTLHVVVCCINGQDFSSTNPLKLQVHILLGYHLIFLSCHIVGWSMIINQSGTCQEIRCLPDKATLLHKTQFS